MGRNKWRILLPVLDIAWLAFIWFHSLRTAAQSEAESGTLLALVCRLLPFMTMTLLRKLAHFTKFAILGALLTLTFCRACPRRASLPLLLGLLAGMCDETIQRFLPGRSCEVRDVWIDFAGVAAAAGLVLVLLQLHRKRHGTAAKRT